MSSKPTQTHTPSFAIISRRQYWLYSIRVQIKNSHFFHIKKKSIIISIVLVKFLTIVRLDCEKSLFSQSSLSLAGLERANWPRGKLETGGKKRVPQVPPSFPAFSPASPRFSLASLDFLARAFLARVTILRDCSQSSIVG